jgi:hypothetical protein
MISETPTTTMVAEAAAATTIQDEEVADEDEDAEAAEEIIMIRMITLKTSHVTIVTKKDTIPRTASDSYFVVKVPPSDFHLVLFFVLVRALPLPTNYLNIMLDVVPVSSRALIGTTVPSLFLIFTIMSAVYCTGFSPEPLPAHVLV